MKTKFKIFTLIAFLLASGTFIYLHHKNSVKSQEIEKYEQNLRAAQDSIRTYQLKNGELAAAKASWVLKEGEMLKQLNMTEGELRDIKKKIGQPTIVTKVITQTKIDTLTMPGKVIYIDKDTVVAPFQYKDNWISMSGKTNIVRDSSATILCNLTMTTPLTIGQTKDHQFFVTTPNPYVRFSDINSVEIEKFQPKKKHWSVGLNMGPGLYYNFKDKNVGYGLGVQFGVNYSF